MAILQEANAVFYHPLDTLTETLQTQLWTGAVKEQTGRVGASKGQADASITYGLPSGLSSSNAGFVDSDALDTTSIVTCFSEMANTVVSAAVGVVSGTNVSYGPKFNVSWAGGGIGGVSVAALSASKFVIVAATQSRIGTVSGTDITFGPLVTIPGTPQSNPGTTYAEVIAMSSSIVVATFASSSPADTVKAVVGVVGGTSVVWDTPATVATLAAGAWIRPAKMAADRFIVAYGSGNTTASKPVFLRGGLVIGSSVAFPDAAVQATLATTVTFSGGFDGQGRVAIVSTGSSTAMLGYFGSMAFVRDVSMPATAPTVGKPSLLSDPVNPSFPSRSVSGPVGDMTMVWDGSLVGVTYATSFGAGATSGTGSSGSTDVLTHLVSRNSSGLVVERGVSTAFENPAIGVVRASSAMISGNIVTSIVAGAAPKTSIGAITPRGMSATTTTFGAEHEFLGSATQQNRITFLDTTKFVVVYSDNTDLNKGKAKVGTISGNDITFGLEATLVASVGILSVATLSATTIVVAYKDLGDLNKGKAKVGTIAGTFIAFGAETAFVFDSGGEFNGGNIAALSSTTFVVAYNNPVLGNDAAKVGTVLGTDITFGAEAVFHTPGAASLFVMSLSAIKFVVAYQVAASPAGLAVVGSVVGTSITFGLPNTFNDAQTIWISATAISATRFVVVYQDGTAGQFHGTANVGTVSGTTITFGAKSKFIAASSEQMYVAAIGSDKIVVAYVNNPAGSHGAVSVGAVFGTDVMFGADAEFLSALAASDLGVAAVGGRYVVVYTDQNDGNHGTSKVGTSYPSSVSATRLVFSTWSRRGLEMAAGAEASVATGLSNAKTAITPLSATAFLVAYTDSSFVRARVLTLSGSLLSVGAESTVAGADVATRPAIVAMDSTTVVLASAGSVAPNRKAFVGTVSGTDVTWGVSSEFDSSVINGFDNVILERLDASRVLLVASRSPAGLSTYSVVGTVSGATTTWGVTSSGITMGVSGRGVRGVVVLSPTTAVATFRIDGGPAVENVAFRVIDIAGTTTVWVGVNSLPPELLNMVNHRIASIDSARFLVVYNDNTDTASNFTEPDQRQTFARVVTVSGTDFTLGARTRLDGSYARPVSLVRISDRRFLLSYVYKGTTQERVLYTATVGVSGTSANFGCSRIATLGIQNANVHQGAGLLAASGGTGVMVSSTDSTDVNAVAIAVKE